MSTVTLRSWIKQGKVNVSMTQGNHYRISEEELNRIMSITPMKSQDRRVVGYCRVSSKELYIHFTTNYKYLRSGD